jgi:hypothetical protein
MRSYGNRFLYYSLDIEDENGVVLDIDINQ